MADRLTQLQDCLDDLATQMFASLRYINTHHAYGKIPGQPDMNPFPIANGNSNTATKSANNATGANATSATNGDSNAIAAAAGTSMTQNQDQEQSQQQQQQADPDADPTPDTPEVFTSSLHELAHDLVLKQQQIEYIISVLPGIGTSETSQTERVKKLEVELRDVLLERVEAEERRERLVGGVERLAGGCRRVV